MLLQLYPHADAPTGVVALFNDLSMTLIESWFSGNIYHFMFGLIAPTVGTNLMCQASWTNGCAFCNHTSTWTGAMQSSVSAAFINPAHATSSGSVAQLTITSVLSGAVAGHYNSADPLQTAGDAVLFAPEQGWGLSGEEGWGGYSLSNTPSTNLQSSLTSGFSTWRVQGVFIPQFAAPTGHPTRKRFGGVTHAQVVKGKNTRVW